MASTMPADLPFGSQAWLSDRPCWCVDLGPTLQAMTTCDVWLGLAKGDIVPEMKVWREGMPYWTAVAKVPEFALALPDAKMWSPVPGHVAAKLVAAMPAVANRPSLAEAADQDGAAPEEPSREDAGEPPPSAVGVLTHAPPSDFATPAPVVVDHDDTPPVSGARRRLFPRLDRRGAASVVAGAAVAIIALALVTTGPVPGGESRPAAAGVRMGTVVVEPGPLSYEPPAAGWPVTIVPAEAPAGAPGATAATASTISTASTVSTASVAVKGTDAMDRSRGLTPGRWRTPRGPRAGDRGQHRARASTR
jgi:GYF domain 2